MSQKSGQSLTDWLANVGYWASYREGPEIIPSSAPEHAAAWLRIRGVVRQELKKNQQTIPVDPIPVDPIPVDPIPVDPIPVDPIPPGPSSTVPWLPIIGGVAVIALLAGRK